MLAALEDGVWFWTPCMGRGTQQPEIVLAASAAAANNSIDLVILSIRNSSITSVGDVLDQRPVRQFRILLAKPGVSEQPVAEIYVSTDVEADGPIPCKMEEGDGR